MSCERVRRTSQFTSPTEYNALIADGDKPAEKARSKGDALNAHECPEPSEHQARPDEGALDRRRVVYEPVGPEGEERREDEADQGEVARDAARRARASVLARGGREEEKHAPVVLPQLLGLGLAAEDLLQRRVDDERAERDLGRDERERLRARSGGQCVRRFAGARAA